MRKRACSCARSFLADIAFQYGCPKKPPTTSDPNPQQSVLPGQQPRLRCQFPLPFPDCPLAHSCPVPANCSTPFWDPIAGKCLCTSETCAFVDDSRPIGVSALNAITETVFLFLRHSPTVPTSLGVELVGTSLETMGKQETLTFLSTGGTAPRPGSFLLVGGKASSWALL